MSPADEIAKLHDLLVSGRLTQAEYEQGKAQILGSNPRAGAHVPVGAHLRRSPTDRWLGGVCGGLAKATGSESWIWRLIFTAAVLFGGVGIVAYVLLWIFVPPEAPGS